jgi:PAS domain S-box-containing protein
MRESHISSSFPESRISEAFEYTQTGMAIIDLKGGFQVTNPSFRRILDRSSDALARESIFSIAHPDDLGSYRVEIDRLISRLSLSFVSENRYLRPDGSAIWVRTSFSLLKAFNAHSSSIILICDDLTEKKQAEQVLLESEKLAIVGRLASSIAHEINNPLEAVINLLYLTKQAQTLEEAHRFASEAEMEINRVAQITTHTLRFHREQMRPVPTDVVELLESVLVLFRGKALQSQVRVHFEKDDCPHLICFPGEIRQVAANLIRNAIEAMPNGGDLQLRVRPATDWRSGEEGVRVTIADNGVGMSVETRRRIYEPFFTTKESLGTGLGLWVTAGILRKHRGAMRLRSSTRLNDSGTAFSLIFPFSGAEDYVRN